ncbi:MAG: Rv3235 family protein [Ancrocorticia sp.]|jgi:hypothetical protein|nr:Rv3235 family protein [Ancrocorticia sp.]MCI1895552.1 Rv3235 family protein [Ancrocorticia sp.]MCI1932343.1 Rv3235 family protein [Ancrocorticia sp.]MCI1962804.1 Rv3235 family protein [Ancrocorticia sp.]MCI2001916.1 Rv3235 family protein [Ancrocorticia sp.]
MSTAADLTNLRVSRLPRPGFSIVPATSSALETTESHTSSKGEASSPTQPPPTTHPSHPWDRLAFSFSPPQPPLWAQEEDSLSQPLPPDAGSPEDVIRAIVIHAIEALLGHRPVGHLRHWLKADVYMALYRRVGLAHRIVGTAPRTRAPRVKSIRYTQPRARAVEAAVVIHDGTRIRAAAVRLEFHRKRWIAVALEIG